jgi:cell division protein FtsB
MNVRVTARAAGLLFISMIVLTFAITPFRANLVQRNELSDLRGQMVRLGADNSRLQQQAAQLKDPSYLEKLSRQCLGMVKPGEIAFVTVPERGAPTPPSC